MATLNMTHDFDCNEETFWKIFFDQKFNLELFENELKFPQYEIKEQKENETQIYRKVFAQPKLDAPKAVSKLLGPGFGYTEEGTFDRKTKIWRWTITTSTLTNKIKQEGTMHLESLGENQVRRITELLLEVKIFGVGGSIEKLGLKTFREAWDKSSSFMKQWIKDGKA